MNKNSVLLVTHGETVPYANGRYFPDPGMTPEGLARMAALAPKMEEFLAGRAPAEIHCGTGRRQKEVADVLGYVGDTLFYGEPIFYSDVWGGAATRVKKGGENFILLGTGMLIPDGQYLTTKHLGPTIRQTIVNLPNGSVICSGRPTLRRLGVPEADWFNGAVYEITFFPLEPDSIACRRLTEGIRL